MAGDPVAWRVIERGWSVLDAAGNEIGKVDEITGDVNADIFDGITVGDGGAVLTRARYVASEHVAEIRDGEVVLDLSPEDAAKLEPYTEPVAEPLADLEPKAEEARKKSMSWAQRLGNTLLGRRP
jgi:uncharacterized protein YrrD